MNEWENEQPLDDNEVRITPLPELDNETNKSKLSSFPSPEPHITTQHVNKLLHIGLVVSLLLLTLLVIPGNVQTFHTMIQGTINTLIPSHVTPPINETDRFYLDVDVPWIHVAIDGTEVHIPLIELENPLKLSSGRHLIVWWGEPFLSQSCVLSVPTISKDTCQVSALFATQAPSASSIQLISLHESLDTLSALQQTPLVNAIKSAFENSPSSDIVQSGELYLTNRGNNIAEQSLLANLHFYLDLGTGSGLELPCQFNLQDMGSQPCVVSGQNCRQLCTVPWQFRQGQGIATAPLEWMVFTVTYLSRDYLSRDGQPIIRGQDIETFGVAENTEHFVMLYLTWGDSGWQVEIILGPRLNKPVLADNLQFATDPACVTAQDKLVRQLSASTQEGYTGYAQLRFISGTNPAAGCLVQATTSRSTGTGTTTPTASQIAYYLERFGVLLAVNDVAHRLQPTLPLINDYQRRLVEQLMPFPGQVVNAQ